jgi:hypothetical protein
MKSILLVLTFLLSQTLFATPAQNPNAKSDDVIVKKASPLDELIRGEMAALKAYDEILAKVKDPDEVKNLTSMKTDHKNALETLKRYASSEVKADTQNSGAWGIFAKAWMKGATVFGDKTALKALNQGEEHGVSEYREALLDKNLSPDVKRIIKSTLLPRQEEHVKTLQTFF